MFVAGLLPKKNAPESAKTSTETSGTTATAPSDPTVVNNEASIEKYAKRLNKYKAGQSPTTLHPARTRSHQPGLSWLGDDEFESTGLAFRLASRLTASKPGGGSGPRNNANLGSGPRKNHQKPRTRAEASDNAGKNGSQPRKDLARKPRSKQVDAKTTKPSLSTGVAASRPTSEPSPAPLQVDLKSTDFASLFGAFSSIPVSPSSTSTEATPTDNASRRAQFTLEQYGGDYSNLVSSSLVTSQGNPIVYAESTMARRRDLGPDRRNTALRIIQGMIGESQGSRPTA